jgi:ribose 5-phosphate isomerase B
VAAQADSRRTFVRYEYPAPLVFPARHSVHGRILCVLAIAFCNSRQHVHLAPFGAAHGKPRDGFPLAERVVNASTSGRSPKMKIAIGSDHAGFRYKEALKARLQQQKQSVTDFGTYSAESVDYPQFIRPVAEAVSRGEFERGIVLGGSGNGEAIVANRVPGIRCAVCWNVESARLARAHNDANMISLGQRFLSEDEAFAIINIWLGTPFEGGRHQRRIEMIDGPSPT